MATAPHIQVLGGVEANRVALATTLRTAGFESVESRGAIAVNVERLPQLVVIVGADPAILCAEARDVPVLVGVPILVVVPGIPADAGVKALASGADDIIVEPVLPAVLGARVRSLIRGHASRREAHELDELQSALLKVQELISTGGDGAGVLRETLLIATQRLGFNRAALIAHIEGSAQAYVIAATDDPSLSQFRLALADYPEVSHAINTAEAVLIADVKTDPITTSIAAKLEAKAVRSLAVFPVMWKRSILGVVLFRGTRAGLEHLTPRRLGFARTFATQAAAHLRHGRVMESLREQTHRISRARYEAERRLRTIDSLKEHFEAAADGVVVLDEDGVILFVNHTAERITGFARDGMVGASLVDLVPPIQRAGLTEVIRSVLSGTNIQAFDLDLSTTSGEHICVSVTTSTVLSRSGAVILSFRDVTGERALEGELRKTKDFLEKLIDSTVDAIVAADVSGDVVLFNQGAERIYGYTAEEVVGKMTVEALYPDGGARQVMRMLRSMSYGGVGRLEQTRREIVNKDRELVPVNMTASMIYGDGDEVATVGIFSDLRDRIRIEQRLLQAQEKLQVTEKQAVVAQLAGTAAHELNQPLQSIIGYTQLILRQSEPDDAHVRAVNVVLRESERMAEIVRKIGRITDYETKEYVGGASILDLEKSSPGVGSLVIPDDEVESESAERETAEFGDDGEPTDAVSDEREADDAVQKGGM